MITFAHNHGCRNPSDLHATGTNYKPGHAEGLVHDSMVENFNFSQYLFAIFTDQMSFSIFKLCVV